MAHGRMWSDSEGQLTNILLKNKGYLPSYRVQYQIHTTNFNFHRTTSFIFFIFTLLVSLADFELQSLLCSDSLGFIIYV